LHLNRTDKVVIIVLSAISLALVMYFATLPPFAKDHHRLPSLVILNVENTTTGDPADGLPDLTILIQNIGGYNKPSFQLNKENCLYVDDVLITNVMIDPPDGLLAAWDMATLTIPGSGKRWGEEITIKIVTLTENQEPLTFQFTKTMPIRDPLLMTISSINWDESTGQIRALVGYSGIWDITLEEVYANETFDDEAVIANRVLSQYQTTEIILSETYVTKPMRITVRVVASDGFDAERTKIFYSIKLPKVDWNKWTRKIRVTVKNVGDDAVTLSEVYVNGTLDASALPNPKILESDQEAEITLSGTFTDTHTPIPIKVITLEGAVDERSAPIYGIYVQSINWNSNTGKIIAYIHSNGYESAGDGRVSSVYINGTKDSSATIQGGNGSWSITLSKTYANNPQQLTLKVVTSDGIFDERTMRPYIY
jgi:hypothetical protein